MSTIRINPSLACRVNMSDGATFANWGITSACYVARCIENTSDVTTMNHCLYSRNIISLVKLWPARRFNLLVLS